MESSGVNSHASAVSWCPKACALVERLAGCTAFFDAPCFLAILDTKFICVRFAVIDVSLPEHGAGKQLHQKIMMVGLSHPNSEHPILPNASSCVGRPNTTRFQVAYQHHHAIIITTVTTTIVTTTTTSVPKMSVAYQESSESIALLNCQRPARARCRWSVFLTLEEVGRGSMLSPRLQS
jgi:hypothetical protein